MNAPFRHHPRARDPLADLDATARDIIADAALGLLVLISGRYRPMNAPSSARHYAPQKLGALIDRGILDRVDCNAITITAKGRSLARVIAHRRQVRNKLNRGEY
jgi:hypothetical protein